MGRDSRQSYESRYASHPQVPKLFGPLCATASMQRDAAAVATGPLPISPGRSGPPARRGRCSLCLQAAAGNEDYCVEVSCVPAPYGPVESNARSGEKDFGIWSSGLVPSSAAQPVRAMGARARVGHSWDVRSPPSSGLRLSRDGSSRRRRRGDPSRSQRAHAGGEGGRQARLRGGEGPSTWGDGPRLFARRRGGWPPEWCPNDVAYLECTTDAVVIASRGPLLARCRALWDWAAPVRSGSAGSCPRR